MLPQRYEQLLVSSTPSPQRATKQKQKSRFNLADHDGEAVKVNTEEQAVSSVVLFFTNN